MIDLILKYKINYLKRHTERIKQWKSYEEVKTISVFFDFADYDKMLPLIELLRKDGKIVRAWSFFEKYQWDESCPYHVLVLNDKHLNFWYLPKKCIIDDMEGFPTDWLLDFSHDENPVLEYLTVCSPSLFRAGFKTADPKVYDFILDISHHTADVKENAEMLVFYLKNLRIK